ncbi:MAG: carboxypeptidase-like regulatory domain-containing protein [Pyrinomonadaceae bacterium]
MNRQKFDVNKFRIASPCPVGWENMNGDARKRFCDSCQLNVYNIAEMTEAEVENLISGNKERICARLYKRADGTVLTRDCPVGVHTRRKRISRFAGAILAAIIGMFSVAFGQSGSKSKKDKECKIVAPAKIFRTETKKDLNIAKGVVKDPAGALVPGATITIKNNQSGKELQTESDDKGEYEFPPMPSGDYSVKIEASGFKTYEIKNFTFNKNEELKIDFILKPDKETEIVGILDSGEPYIDMSKTSLDFNISRDRFFGRPYNE